MLAPTVTWDAGMIGSNGAGAKSKHSRCGGSDDSSATRANVQTLTSDATAIATLRAFNVLSFGPLGGLTFRIQRTEAAVAADSGPLE